MFRIIGDIHGKTEEYVGIINSPYAPAYSVQVGDFGFKDAYAANHSNPAFHKILGGNHDDYTRGENGEFTFQTPHFLGNWGIHEFPGNPAFFFLRGGYSIDKARRIEGISWWEDEQLSDKEMRAALAFYEKEKPSFVITHECPASIISCFSSRQLLPSKTAQLLQIMWEIHNPAYWIFGHHHQNWMGKRENTTFVCLGELSFLDFGKLP